GRALDEEYGRVTVMVDLVEVDGRADDVDFDAHLSQCVLEVPPGRELRLVVTHEDAHQAFSRPTAAIFSMSVFSRLVYRRAWLRMRALSALRFCSIRSHASITASERSGRSNRT